MHKIASFAGRLIGSTMYIVTSGIISSRLNVLPEDSGSSLHHNWGIKEIRREVWRKKEKFTPVLAAWRTGEYREKTFGWAVFAFIIVITTTISCTFLWELDSIIVLLLLLCLSRLMRLICDMRKKQEIKTKT